MLCGLSIFCVMITTWLVPVCVNSHKSGRLSECVLVVGYVKKFFLKIKGKIGDNQSVMNKYEWLKYFHNVI